MSTHSPYHQVEKLYFVWNADWSLAGAMQAIQEWLTQTSTCALCEIAYAGIRPKAEWQQCQAAIPVPVEILCRNQLSPALQAASGDAFPVVIAQTAQGLILVLEREAIAACEGDVERFRVALEAALNSME
ncbi:MAG: hypothetical protein F6J87_02770 [Spirulina sp. SIO3F2]|nr:hypothetical protein [Spirulina sp. SIO3F2]